MGRIRQVGLRSAFPVLEPSANYAAHEVLCLAVRGVPSLVADVTTRNKFRLDLDLIDNTSRFVHDEAFSGENSTQAAYAERQ